MTESQIDAIDSIFIEIKLSSGEGDDIPSPPRNLEVVNITPTSIRLTWDASTDLIPAAGHHIYRNGARIVSTMSFVHEDFDLSPSTRYCYQVSAYDDAGKESDKTDPVCATTLPAIISDTEKPTVPQNLSAMALSPTQIKLTWDASADNVGVAGYRIHRDGSYIISVMPLTYTDFDLDPSTLYCYQVSAYDAAGNESDASAPVCAETLSIGDVFNGIDMVFVLGGTFTMGCTAEQLSDCNDNEKPEHYVTLNDFYIGKYEVTQAQWKAVMGSENNPSYFRGDNLPVEQVSWNDVQDFIKILNERTGKNYRLPTEAEWEYAARGGNNKSVFKYSGSNNVGEVAWHDGNSENTTHAVGTKKANELGIYDMSGNVYEWVSDRYDKYSDADQTNPTGPATGSYRVERGGSWLVHEWRARVSYRDYIAPDRKDQTLGFRLASSSK
jgi:formylglycine-generating enzyme required for sulfatase activity